MPELAYVQGHNASVYRSHESRNAENTCGFFLQHLRPDSKVLDAGCGPGTVSSSLALLVPQGRVLGVDAVQTAIDKARAQANLPANCSFEVADLTALEYEDDTFDVIFTSQVLVHIPAAVKAMSELRRVCKPGGFIACREGDFASFVVQPPSPPIEQWKNIMIDIMHKKECHPDGGRHLVEWALQVGFASDNITLSAGGVAYAGSERKFWGETMAGRMQADQTMRDHAVQSGAATEADFEAMRAGWVSWMEDPVALFMMPCYQVICFK